MIFFRFAKIFQFFIVAPHQQFFEIFEKVEFLQGHKSWKLVMVPFSSVSDPLSEKLKLL